MQNGLWAIFGCWDISNIVLGVFEKILNLNFFKKHPKLFSLYISNEISLRCRFVFKTNGRISFITSCKDHCCSFYTSWEIKQQKKCILHILKKTPNFGCMVRTLDEKNWRKDLILANPNVLWEFIVMLELIWCITIKMTAKSKFWDFQMF